MKHFYLEYLKNLKTVLLIASVLFCAGFLSAQTTVDFNTAGATAW